MVEHNLNVVANLSDIITVLTRGKVLAEGNYADLTKDERVKEAYLGAGHGEDGIQGIPQGHLFGIFDLSQPTTLYYVILGGFLLGFLLIYRTINSPFGEVLKSIRENEQRAISLGYKTDQYKLLAYILSGTLSGLAGSLKVFVAQNASLTDVHWTMSGEIVLMTLVGGLGTVFGPVVGAFIIIAMLQLDVLKARLDAEYSLPVDFEISEFQLARWISSDDRKKLDAFVSANGSGVADDVDGDPVFLARNQFYLDYTRERSEGITFSNVKDVKKTA